MSERHEWQQGESVQWGALGLPPTAAASSYRCAKCEASFVHRYNIEPSIYRAMEAAGITDACLGKNR